MKTGRKLNETSLRILRMLLDKKAITTREFMEIAWKDRMPWDYRSVFLKFRDLENAGYLSKRKKNNQSFFHLAPKGKLRVLKYLGLERLKIKKWDKQWRVVIFDLPETLKKWRDFLRRELKAMGFFPLQESVYIIPYPVTGELDEWLTEWGLRKYVRYLTVSEIDGESVLRKVFDLK